MTATPLPAGAPPTAALAAGALTLGIPAGAQGDPGAPAPRTVVAAGRFGPQGGVQWSTDKLQAKQITGVSALGLFYLTSAHLAELGADRRWVVDGTVLTSVGDPAHTFELVAVDPALAEVLKPLGPNAPDLKKGLIVRVVGIDGKAPVAGFTVQISDFTGGGG